jgi:hypothetical protein
MEDNSKAPFRTDVRLFNLKEGLEKVFESVFPNETK